MRKINWPRMILGGVVAGLIINAFEYVLNRVVLAKDREAATNALGKHLGPPEFLLFTVWGFLVGIFAVWLYAAIRPRYGAGPNAALCAAVAVWFLGYLLADPLPLALKLFPTRVMVIGLSVGLVEVIMTTLVGAWSYREAAA